MTDGEDNASRENLEDAVKQLQVENGPSVYAIGILGDEEHPKRARRALEVIAQRTGGLAFFSPRSIRWMKSAVKWRTTSRINTPSATSQPFRDPAAASARFASMPSSRATTNWSCGPKVATTQARNQQRREQTSPCAHTMSHPIILYDGVCGLCNRFVQFILHRDHNAVFRFASLQSGLAATILARHRANPVLSTQSMLPSTTNSPANIYSPAPTPPSSS